MKYRIVLTQLAGRHSRSRDLVARPPLIRSGRTVVRPDLSGHVPLPLVVVLREELHRVHAERCGGLDRLVITAGNREVGTEQRQLDSPKKDRH